MRLKGKSVLITRAASQSGALKASLEFHGAEVIEFPTIEIVPVADWSEVDRAIASLNTYQWMIFTSTNAVDAFCKRVVRPAQTVSIPIAVIGPATARRLNDWKLAASIIPADYRAEGLLAVLPPDLSGIRILFPRAESARDLLPDELRRRGATVDLVAVYRTVRPLSSLRTFREVLAESRVDCVAFASPSSIRNLVESLDEPIAAVLDKIPVAVIGPVTRTALRCFDLDATIQAEHATMEALAEAIARAL